MVQRLRYAELAPDGIAALRNLEHYLNSSTALSAPLLEFVRLRASQLNGCHFCIQIHSKELRKHHEPESRIEAVSRWQDSDAFTPRERAALAWAESVTLVSHTHVPDDDYAAVNEFFHQKDLVDLTLAVATINAWNRLAIPFRMEWNPPAKHAEESSPQPVEQHPANGEVSAIENGGGKVAGD